MRRQPLGPGNRLPEESESNFEDTAANMEAPRSIEPDGDIRASFAWKASPQQRISGRTNLKD
jgi:hypothetical protein